MGEIKWHSHYIDQVQWCDKNGHRFYVSHYIGMTMVGRVAACGIFKTNCNIKTCEEMRNKHGGK